MAVMNIGIGEYIQKTIVNGIPQFNNLWVSNAMVSEPVSMRRYDGEWFSFPYAGNINVEIRLGEYKIESLRCEGQKGVGDILFLDCHSITGFPDFMGAGQDLGVAVAERRFELIAGEFDQQAEGVAEV